MVKEWAICCCLQWASGELFNKKQPFSTYYVIAETAEKAIQKLKDELKVMHILVIHGTPKLRLISKAEYENG